ncbi:MAG: hypothetical protein AB4063_00465 [Crocosphaera sp.]
MSTHPESFRVGAIRVIRSIPERKSPLQSVRVMDGNPALSGRAALGGCQLRNAVGLTVDVCGRSAADSYESISHVILPFVSVL